MLVFGIVYGILAKTKFFDERISAIIAMVLGFFVTAYSGIGAYFVALSGIGATLISGLLIVVLFITLFGFRIKKGEPTFKIFTSKEFGFLLVALALVLFWVAGGAAWTGIELTSEAWAAIFALVAIGFVVTFVTKKEEKAPAVAAPAGKEQKKG